MNCDKQSRAFEYHESEDATTGPIRPWFGNPDVAGMTMVSLNAGSKVTSTPSRICTGQLGVLIATAKEPPDPPVCKGCEKLPVWVPR